MAERISSQEWHIFHALSARVDGALEAGLQVTLPSAAGHMLRGARRANPIEYNGPADACRDSFGTYREYARQREILLPNNRTCPKTVILHAIGNAGSCDQAG